MKSKSIATLLSIFFGSGGVQRFYLGQNNRGWLYILLLWFFLPAVVWAIKTYTGFFYWEALFFGWIALLFLVHIGECIYFISLSREKFKLADKSKGNTWLLTIFSLVITSVLAYGVFYLFSLNSDIDIDKAEPEFSISSMEYSQSLFSDEEAFRKKYANKVLQVDGKVSSTGMDFSEGNFLILESAQNTSIDLKCFFNSAHQSQLLDISKGMLVTLKGVCNGRFLENCSIMDKKPAPEMPVPVDTSTIQTDSIKLLYKK
ncbi:MAG: NINE protein [Chitinophagales bacterium]